MSDDRSSVPELLQRLGVSLSRLADTSPEARAILHDLGLLLGAIAGGDVLGPETHAARSQTQTPPASQASLRAPSQPEFSPLPTTSPPPSPVPHPKPAAIVPLRIGDITVHVPVSGSTAEIGRARQSAALEREIERKGPLQPGVDAFPAELAMIATRCELKARACPVARRRRGLNPGDAEFDEVLGELKTMIERGKALPGCFLWMFWPNEPLPSDAVMEMIERNYANLSNAASTVSNIESAPELRGLLQQGVELLAEAQSALRVALESTWLTRPDADQDHAFIWLAAKTKRDSVYIARHMRLEDRADPGDHASLSQRLAELTTHASTIVGAGKARKAAINKLRYHTKRIVEAGAQADGADWTAASNAATRLVEAGVSARDSEAQEIVRPLVAATMPEELAPSDALRAMLERAAEIEERDAEEDAAGNGGVERVWSASVDRTRELLRGSRVVLIGGEVYDHAARRLQSAFDLADLCWVSLREHSSSRPMENEIADPATRVVLAMVKLAGHQHIDDARDFCRRYGKPLVMLKAGYNPEQIARAVLEQASTGLIEAAG